MTPGHGQHRTVTCPGPRRGRVVRDPGVSRVEVMFFLSAEHSPRLFREMGPGGPSLGGYEASLVSSSTFQSPGPTSEGRPSECDVVEAGSDPVVVL